MVPSSGQPPHGMIKIKPYMSLIILCCPHTALPYIPMFAFIHHLVEFLTITFGFYTISNDHDSMKQHSQPQLPTPRYACLSLRGQILRASREAEDWSKYLERLRGLSRSLQKVPSKPPPAKAKAKAGAPAAQKRSSTPPPRKARSP